MNLNNNFQIHNNKLRSLPQELLKLTNLVEISVHLVVSYVSYSIQIYNEELEWPQEVKEEIKQKEEADNFSPKDLFPLITPYLKQTSSYPLPSKI